MSSRKDVWRVTNFADADEVYEVYDAEGKHEKTFDSVQEAFAYCVEHRVAVFFHP